ncbi:MAG: hypothetical protein JWN78_2738 [Bacteroidota bacterium]|nr:hypothetical protein [Bacteroidota bacterium]
MENETIDQSLPESGNPDTKPYTLKFGIIGGFASVIVSLILYFTNMQFASWAKWLSTLILFIIIILGLKAIANGNRNKIIPFGTLFGAGMKITLIITIISVIYFVIYMNFIETDFIAKILDASRQQMAEKGLSEEQIDRAVEMSSKFMSPWLMIVFMVIGSLIFGAIASLIGAAIYKKEK